MPRRRRGPASAVSVCLHDHDHDHHHSQEPPPPPPRADDGPLTERLRAAESAIAQLQERAAATDAAARAVEALGRRVGDLTRRQVAIENQIDDAQQKAEPPAPPPCNTSTMAGRPPSTCANGLFVPLVVPHASNTNANANANANPNPNLNPNSNSNPNSDADAAAALASSTAEKLTKLEHALGERLMRIEIEIRRIDQTTARRQGDQRPQPRAEAARQRQSHRECAEHDKTLSSRSLGFAHSELRRWLDAVDTTVAQPQP